MNENRHGYGTLFAGSAFALICACGGPTILPGPARDVAKSAADAWIATGHACDLKGDLAYCDMHGGGLPLIVGYGAGSQLLFATVFDTKSAFGRACESIQLDRVMRPEWMIVKCDDIELADRETRKVLSIAGGGRLSSKGMSASELVHSANLFLEEAEGFLVRLKDFLALPGR